MVALFSSEIPVLIESLLRNMRKIVQQLDPRLWCLVRLQGHIKTVVLRLAAVCQLLLFQAEVARITVDTPVSKSGERLNDWNWAEFFGMLTTTTESAAKCVSMAIW